MVLLAPHVGKSKSALMGSVTLPSSNTALMEEDRPGKTRKELRSEMLLGLSHWGIKRGRAAVTASRRLAPSSKAQHQNPTIFYILPVCPAAACVPWQPGQRESQRSCRFVNLSWLSWSQVFGMKGRSSV